MKKIALAAALVLAAVPAHAADKITTREAITLATALRNLDGHMVVVKQNGQDALVMIPWEFGSGSLRLRIANDLAIVDPVVNNAERARQSIVGEILKRTGATEIKPGTPAYDDLQHQYDDVMEQPAAGTQDLARIKASELKLDRNEIAVTVLQALKPIMDGD